MNFTIFYSYIDLCPWLQVDGSGLGIQPLVPRCEETNWTHLSTLLTLPSILMLSQSLPPTLRTPWRPLFNSRLHGESFATLSKCITDKGPCIMIIKDTGGSVFGAYASEGWVHKAHFYGKWLQGFSAQLRALAQLSLCY